MAKKRKKRGSLYLIPTTLGDTEPLEVLPLSVKRTIEGITYFIVENEKSARRFIKKIHPRKSQASLVLMALNKFTDASQIPSFLDPCLEGHDVGVLSEAGSPAVADPGAEVVKIAHEKGIAVVPMVGPSSLLLALMGSGLNGQQFAFHGYLPIDKADRKKKIKELEKESREKDQTQLFIETPYRNNSLIHHLLATLSKKTYLCIAADLTLPTEFISTLTIDEWQEKIPDLHKRPTLFLIKA
ncbi:MAG: SAM-dependent methyltransferase [Flavobacteriaceae bacterium]|nr:SAM-dependent methyltransferase [Flavobacteriaceae bacterium]